MPLASSKLNVIPPAMFSDPLAGLVMPYEWNTSITSPFLVWVLILEISAFPVAVNFAFTVTVFSSPEKPKPVICTTKGCWTETYSQPLSRTTTLKQGIILIWISFVSLKQSCLSPAVVVNPLADISVNIFPSLSVFCTITRSSLNFCL